MSIDTSIFDDVSDKLSEARDTIMQAADQDDVINSLLLLHESIALLLSVTRDKVAEAAAK